MVFSFNRFFNKLWDIMRKFECLFQNMLTFSEYLNCCQFYTQRACIFRYLYLKLEYIVCWEICGHTHMPIVNDYKSKNVTLTLTWYKSVINKLFSNFLVEKMSSEGLEFVTKKNVISVRVWKFLFLPCKYSKQIFIIQGNRRKTICWQC